MFLRCVSVSLITLLIPLAATGQERSAAETAGLVAPGRLPAGTGLIVVYFAGPEPVQSRCAINIQFSGLIDSWYDHTVRSVDFPNAELAGKLQIDVSGRFVFPHSVFGEATPGAAIVLPPREWQDFLSRLGDADSVEFNYFLRLQREVIEQMAQIQPGGDIEFNTWGHSNIRVVEARIPPECASQN